MAAVIQSLGYYVAPVMIVLAGVMGKWFLDVWFVPRYHINGAAFSTVLVFFGMTVCFYFVLKGQLKQSLFTMKNMRIIVRSAVVMGVALLLFNTVFEWLFPSQARWVVAIQALLGVVFGATIFIVTILRANLFKQEELVLLPFGYKWVRYNKWRSNEKHE
jgi:PST family polysaccharide transporter